MERSLDPVLDRFRAALDALYGRRLARVVLFGSRARGDARAASDYDVAVFIEGLSSLGTEAGRIAAIGTDILIDTGAVINDLPFAAGAYGARTGLMGEVRREGRTSSRKSVITASTAKQRSRRLRRRTR